MVRERTNNFLEIKKCFICKNSKLKKLFTHKIQNSSNLLSQYLNNQTINYYQCYNCKLVFLSPILNEDILNEYYQSQIIDVHRNKNAYLKIFQEILKYKTKGNFLDVGSSAGELIELAKDNNFKSSSVEMSKRGINFLKSKGINVFAGNFFKLKLPENFFTVISFLTILEHFLNPLFALKKANKLLKKNGILVFSVPYYGLSAKILKAHWLYLSPFIGHIYCFSYKSILKMLQKANFKLLKIKYSTLSPELTFGEQHPKNILLKQKFLQKVNAPKIWELIRKLKIGDAVLVIAKKI